MPSALDIVKRTIQANQSMQNSALERLRNINAMAKEVNAYVTMGDQNRLDSLKRLHSEYETRMSIIENLDKIDVYSLSNEERVAIEDARRSHLDRIISLGLVDGNPLKASLMPVRNESEAKTKETNLDYVLSVAEGYGVPADTREYIRETAYNNQHEFSGKGYKFENGYDTIPERMQGYLVGKFAGYVKSDIEDDVDVVVSQNVQKQGLTFAGLARNKFTELSRNESMSTQQRMSAALDYAFEQIGDVSGSKDVDGSNSMIAEYFVTKAMESITDYRKSEGIKTLAEFDGYRAQNLIKARDGINSIFSGLVNLTPEELSKRMNNSVGFRDAMVIAEQYGSVDEGGFFKKLSKRMTDINPLIASGSISMSERMDLVRKNVLDVLAGEVSRQRRPQPERIEAMKIIQRIDDQIDMSYGSIDPDVRAMIDAVSTKWIEGFSGFALENAEYIERAEAAGRKTFQSMNGKMYSIDGSVTDDQAEFLKNSASFDFFVDMAGDKNGNLLVGGGNSDFFFGNGGSAGAIAMFDAVMTNRSIDGEGEGFPVFQTSGGKTALDAIRKSVVKAAVTEDGKSYVADLFKPAKKGNRLFDSKIGEGLATFEIGKEKYYLPQAVIDAVDMGVSGNSGNMINKALGSGNVKEVMAGILSVYQDSVQNASEYVQDNLVANYYSIYPNVKPSGNIYEENVSRSILEAELDMVDTSEISFLFDGSVDFSELKGYQLDKLRKHMEGLEERINLVDNTNEWGVTKFGSNTMASIDNSPVSIIINQSKDALNVLAELHDIEKRLVGLGYDKNLSASDFVIFGPQGAGQMAEARIAEKNKLMNDARELYIKFDSLINGD